MPITRAEHLLWCKERALEYVDNGDLQQAYASMVSDLGKHPGTQKSRETCVVLGMGELTEAMQLNAHEGKERMRKFIEGFQ